MAEQVGEQNQPTSQTDLPDADAADIFVKRRTIELCYAHNRRKTEDASHHQSGDRTNSRFIPANAELAGSEFCAPHQEERSKSVGSYRAIAGLRFSSRLGLRLRLLSFTASSVRQFQQDDARSCSRGFRVIFAARSPRSIGSLLGLLDAATMHRTPNAGAAVIFARRNYAESSLLIVLVSKPGRCRAAF